MKKNWGLLILRLSLGAVFLYYAIYDKFLHPQSTVFLIQQVTPWFPASAVILIGVLELVVALSLISGAYAKKGALLGAAMMLPILYLAKMPNDIAVLGALIALYQLGPGPYTVKK